MVFIAGNIRRKFMWKTSVWIKTVIANICVDANETRINKLPSIENVWAKNIDMNHHHCTEWLRSFACHRHLFTNFCLFKSREFRFFIFNSHLTLYFCQKFKTNKIIYIVLFRRSFSCIANGLTMKLYLLIWSMANRQKKVRFLKATSWIKLQEWTVGSLTGPKWASIALLTVTRCFSFWYTQITTQF